MKYNLLLSTIIVMFSVVGCSSNPKRTGNTGANSRTVYIEQTNEQLDKWDSNARKLSGDRAASLRAHLQDARAELRDMEAAPESGWTTHKARVNNALSRIRSNYKLAE